LNADLTLKKLSERLMIHYNHLSQIVNEKLQHSFNDFINKYRIEEACKKLLDPVEGKKTVLEIAYDTGFYSKSVFNTAFKKFTGMTPSQFKKKHQQE
jgi:AraC-like DNA-binding protein